MRTVEAPSAVIFTLGLAGNRLIDVAHKPADVGQLQAPLPDALRYGMVLRVRQRVMPEVLLSKRGAFLQPMPSLADLVVRPQTGFRCADVQDQVVVLRASCPPPCGPAFGCSKLILSIL